MTATYTKLKSGGWGIRCAGTVTKGSTVTVEKKSGDRRVETIADVLWSGKDTRTGVVISLCAIVQYSSAPQQCRICGERRWSTGDGRTFGPKIYRNGICSNCYREAEMGY